MARKIFHLDLTRFSARSKSSATRRRLANRSRSAASRTGAAWSRRARTRREPTACARRCRWRRRCACALSDRRSAQFRRVPRSVARGDGSRQRPDAAGRAARSTKCFLDATMLPDPAEDIARRLQATINDDLRPPCFKLGVATNKLVAKIANTVGKARAGPATRPTRSRWCRPAKRPRSWRRCPSRSCGAWGRRPPSSSRGWACAPSATSRAGRKATWSGASASTASSLPSARGGSTSARSRRSARRNRSARRPPSPAT